MLRDRRTMISYYEYKLRWSDPTIERLQYANSDLHVNFKNSRLVIFWFIKRVSF